MCNGAALLCRQTVLVTTLLHPSAVASARQVLLVHPTRDMRIAQPLNWGFNASIIVRGTDGLWLDTAELASGEGSLSFEVKGKNDANITIRCEPQVDASNAPDTMPVHSVGGGELGQTCALPTLPLTVVLGSHRNTKLKLCGGMDCHVLVRYHKHSCASCLPNAHATQVKLIGPIGVALSARHKHSTPAGISTKHTQSR